MVREYLHAASPAELQGGRRELGWRGTLVARLRAHPAFIGGTVSSAKSSALASVLPPIPGTGRPEGRGAPYRRFGIGGRGWRVP